MTALSSQRLRLGVALAIALGLSLMVVQLARAAGTVSLTALGTAYPESFDTLASSGTSSVVPTGWDFAETGTNANATYTAGTGSGNAGDTYSFGAAATTERAFGMLQSGSLVPTLGASFTNNTGSLISTLAVSYVGEQWRLGTLARVDRVEFQYSLHATSLTAASRWQHSRGIPVPHRPRSPVRRPARCDVADAERRHGYRQQDATAVQPWTDRSGERGVDGELQAVGRRVSTTSTRKAAISRSTAASSLRHARHGNAAPPTKRATCGS